MGSIETIWWPVGVHYKQHSFTDSKTEKAMRKFLMGSSASGLTMGAGFLGLGGAQAKEAPHMVKVADLPIYDEQPPVSRQAYVVESAPTPFLEQKVSDVRTAVQSWWGGSEKTRERLRDTYEIGKAHSQSTLELLRDDTKVLPRAILISTGGLVGLLLAYRKGFFRKIIYTGIGLGGTAALCYPNATKDLARTSYANALELKKTVETKVDRTLNSGAKRTEPLAKTNAEDTTRR